MATRQARTLETARAHVGCGTQAFTRPLGVDAVCWVDFSTGSTGITLRTWCATNPT
jgi:hypothetical protein